MALIRKFQTPDHPDPPPAELEKKKRRTQDHDESNWLVSYADMMTLLCGFFIMMFSMSKVNTNEFEKVKEQVSKHFGTKYESPTEDLSKFVTQVIQETGVAKEVSITSDGTSVSLAFHSTLFFGSLSAEISAEGQQIIDRIADGLVVQQKKLGKNYKLVVEGHTDSQPILGGPFPSNWELSSARATRVIRLFLEQGFLAQNLLAIGYADTQPVMESRKTDGSWDGEALAKNRRVILRVLLPEVDSIPWKMKTAGSIAKAETTLQPVPTSMPVAGNRGVAPASVAATGDSAPAPASKETKPLAEAPVNIAVPVLNH